MSIVSIYTDTAGQIGVNPRRVKIVCTDSLATVTTAGYLNSTSLEGYVIYGTDVIDMVYLYSAATDSGTYEVFTPSISNGIITLVAWANPGDVLLPVVSNDFANFNGTTGQIKDAGYSPTNAAKTKVVMANGAVTVGHIGVFTDTAGTLGQDGTPAINGGNIQAGLSGTAGTLASFPSTASKGSLIIAGVANTGNTNVTLSNAAHGQASVYSIPDSGQATANIITSDNATGQTINTGNLTVTAGSITTTNGGVIQSGSSGHAGSLKVFPTTASKGDFKITCADQTGNTEVTLQASAMGQATAISLPDPAGATANVVLAPAALVSGNVVKASGTAGLIVDAGFALHAGTTAAYAGGGTSNAYVTTNMTSSSIVTATILAQTNAASIVKAVPGTNTLTVTFSADPGANTTVSWISITPAVA